MRARRPHLLILALTLAFSLSACSKTGEATASPEPTAAQTPTGEAKFVLPRTASTLHPILGTERTNLALAPLIWEGLFELDATFTPQNVLCERYEVSADGLTWTFYLRSGATFSDGSAFSASEAVFSLNLARTGNSRYSFRLADITSVKGEGNVLTVTLSSPNGDLPALLDVPIVKGESEEPLGTGPYVLKSSSDGDTLVARTDWWQKRALPTSSIPLKMVAGADELILAFDSGEVSMVTSDLTGTNTLNFAGGYEVWDSPSTIMLYVGFNAQKGACADPLVRQALSRGFDRQTVASVLYSGRATSAVLPISPACPYYDQILGAETKSDYSAAAMTDLLTQAGYTKSGEIIKKGRTAFTLTLIVNSESSFKTATADHLAEELSKQGIQVQISKLGWAEYEAALKAKQFDLYIGETMLAPDFDLSDLLGRSGPLNYGGFSDSQAEMLLHTFRAADVGTRPAAAAALCDYLQVSCPFTPLCFKNTSVLTGWGIISGLAPTQQNAFYQMWNWTLNLK